MSRYIIVLPRPLSEQDWRRFGCDEFAADGYDIIPLEVGPAFGLGSASNAVSRFRGALVLQTMAALERFVAALSPADVVLVELRVSGGTRRFFELLHRLQVCYVAVDLGTLPDRLANRRSALTMREFLELRVEDWMLRGSRLKRFATQIASQSISGRPLQPPSLWVTGGVAVSVLSARLPWARRTRRVSAPSFDYLTAAAVAPSALTARPYAVFLDEAFPDHPDYDLLGTSSPVTSSRYWASLEGLFCRVESLTGLHVAVAPHPKTRGLVPDSISARLAQAQTAALVRASSLVICHASTAVSFAVLFRKPLMFVTTDEIERSGFRGSIARMSSCFGLRRVNADRFITSEITVPRVDERCYAAYEHSFLRASNAVNTSPWDIIRMHAKPNVVASVSTEGLP